MFSNSALKFNWNYSPLCSYKLVIDLSDECSRDKMQGESSLRLLLTFSLQRVMRAQYSAAAATHKVPRKYYYRGRGCTIVNWEKFYDPQTEMFVKTPGCCACTLRDLTRVLRLHPRRYDCKKVGLEYSKHRNDFF